MKATDLMIGDWVKIIHHHTPKPLIKVKKVDLGDFSDALLQVYPEITYEPIPLTPEILEKNGFKEVDMNDFRLFRDKEYDCKGIRISFTNKGVRLWKGDSIGIACKSSGCCHYGIPAYVHLLQHALKLCGIEKEIVL